MHIKNKKRLAIMSLVIGLSLSSDVHKEKKYNIKLLDDNSLAYASYDYGLIYIGDSEFLSKLANLGDHDIIIEDLRYRDDPDIQIHDSYKIKDIALIEEIIMMLDQYEKDNPSNWDRSIYSMENEWIVHNLAYESNYNKTSSKSVDLNNADEDIYKIYKLR